MCEHPVLKNPDFKKLFILQSYTSDHGVGGVLSQLDDDGNDHLVGFFSRRLLPYEERYPTIENKCLTIKLMSEHLKFTFLAITPPFRLSERVLLCFAAQMSFSSVYQYYLLTVFSCLSHCSPVSFRYCHHYF